MSSTLVASSATQMVGSGMIQPTFVFFLTLTEDNHGFENDIGKFWIVIFSVKNVSQKAALGLGLYPLVKHV
tara:strand:+ start:283 stop:495 length:213 start_codon:yes stop_codon:yes gene_type:complete